MAITPLVVSRQHRFPMFTCYMGQVNILTCNCQGIGQPQKRATIRDQLSKKKKYQTYCLQDTHIQPGSNETLVRKQWGGKCYFSSDKSNSRGVAILFGKDIDYNVHDVISDRNGNFLILDVTTEAHRCT